MTEAITITMDTIVEKQMKISEIAMTIEKAMEAFDKGYHEAGITMLQAQADDLLRMADLTEDADIRAELLLLCEQLESFGQMPITAESIARSTRR